MENKKEKRLTERYEIAKILANNFTPQEYDESDFEWCAFQLVQAGYRKQSDVAKEIFKELDNILKTHKISFFSNNYDDYMPTEIRKLKKKFTGAGCIEIIREYFETVNLGYYGLEGCEFTDDDFNTIASRMKNDIDNLEAVMHDYLLEIREVLDEGLED